MAEPAEAAEALDDLLADCAQAEASLLASLSEDAEAERLLDLAEAAAAPNFASLRQRYRVLQQAIQTATGRLRGRLRDQLVQASPELARLAVHAFESGTQHRRGGGKQAVLARAQGLLHHRIDLGQPRQLR